MCTKRPGRVEQRTAASAQTGPRAGETTWGSASHYAQPTAEATDLANSASGTATAYLRKFENRRTKRKC